jgi:peptidoglycan/LPS O-acetylase OafA/YrhL
MCTSDASAVPIFLLVGVAPFAGSWVARRRGTRAAALVALGLCAALALLAFWSRPQGIDLARYGPERQFTFRLLGDVMPWALAGAAALWAVVAWRPGAPVKLAAVALALVALACLVAWAGVETFGPNVCDELMRSPTPGTA